MGRWFVIDSCVFGGCGPHEHAEGGQHLAYLSAVELSFEISFDGSKWCGYCVVGTRLRF